MSVFVKDPAARLDYAIDWSAVAGSGGLAQSSWVVEPEGLVVAVAAWSGARSAATLEGGVAGRVYRVTNQVTLGDGRVDARTLAVRVDAR
jgi:hypothetical protein